MYTTLLVNTENGICTITINRPDKLNALNKAVFDDLNTAFDHVESDQSIRSVIITGAGPKSFVAGADIAEFSNHTVDEAKALSRRGHETFFKIERCSKPVIAAINGFTLGGGCELAMSCHFRIAVSHAKFGQPEVNLGLIPGYGGTQRLVQLIGKGRALELLMSGSLIDATTALQYGMVNYVTTPEELLPKATELLALINTKAPLAIAACIATVNAVYDETENGFEKEINLFGQCFGTADMQEGVSAFLEKRKAVFTGK